MSFTAPAQAAPRPSGGLNTPERMANIAANISRYEWARKSRDSAASRARRWVAKSDEELWAMVPGQALPRCIDATMTYVKNGKVRPGCLVCGKEVFKHGNYPYAPDIEGKPWKITCPSCHSVFPTNDFGAYYRSGIDKDGCFNPEVADRSLLFNADHPDPNDPLHTWGVDDGYGCIDKDGLHHRYIAYYTWKLWDHIQGGVNVLAEAYRLTGEAVYARKCAILLDRIADVYPDMDWNAYAVRGWYHSDGGSKQGKIEGRIWETGVLRGFALSYDKIIVGLAGQDELYAFLAAKASTFNLPTPKGTRAQLLQNIDERILRCGADAIRAKRIWGNEGMHQAAMAACAIALDTEPDTGAMIDWVFAENGGHIPAVIVGGIDRDGVGAEAGPGYALSWGSNIGAVADLLAMYGKYTTHDIYRDFPQFVQTFTAGSRITILNYDTPSIGDAGSTGSIGKVQCNPDFIVRGYRFLRDPDIAMAAFRENGGSATGLGRDISLEDGEAIEREIAKIAADQGAKERSLGSHNMSGYGFLTLENGVGKNGAGVFMYYGRNRGHGHLDRLNIGVYGSGFDLTPDLGYPEFATSWPKRNEWTRQTIAHNTVVVNERSQDSNWVGHPCFFKALPGFQAAEVESRDVYPMTDDYRRTLIWVPTSAETGYLVDVFRVEGGEDHVRSFHGPGTDIEVSGLKLTPQENGTLAGEDVPFGTSRPNADHIGFSWLTAIERDSEPQPSWWIDWRVPSGYRGATDEQNVHIRLWNAGEANEVILANGEPPQNKRGNPRWLRYCLTRRRGADLASTFVSVCDPYENEPKVVGVERLTAAGAAAPDENVALRISLKDGRQHVIMYSARGTRFAVEGIGSFEGRMGFVEVAHGRVAEAGMVAGTHLQALGTTLTADRTHWRGKITGMFSREAKTVIRVDADLPVGDTLTDSTIIVQNDRARNACYRIEAVYATKGDTEVVLGRVSLVRGHVDTADYTKGYVQNITPGDAFEIPCHAYLTTR